jgi:hypothetical protein
MTVSGLGSMRTPLTPAPVRSRPLRAPAEERNDFDSLTRSDRELIFQTTGERVVPGFDPAKEQPSTFAAVLAAERASGRLAPGQEACAVYLKDLDRRYARSGGLNPIGPYLGKAVDYLSRSGARRIDVSA